MSNTIYNKKYNYVYQIKEISTNRFYIGVRSSNDEPELDLGIKYFSSSTDSDFIRNQKDNSFDYEYIILSTFDDRGGANLEEQRLHELYKVDTDDMYINKRISNGDFTSYGNVIVKDKNGNVFMTSLLDEKYLNGEYVSYPTGMVCVKDETDSYIMISRDDERYTSGEYVGTMFGKTVVVDSIGNRFVVSKYDDRFKTGEIKHMNSGKLVVKDDQDSTYHVYTNDERYISGELKHVNSGKIMSQDKHGNIFSVYKDDSRYLSGELFGIAKNKVAVRDTQGNIHFVDIDDPRYKSGEFIHINKGKITAKDFYDNRYSVYKNDPRYISGELIGSTGFWYSIDDIIYTKKQVVEKYKITENTLYKRCKSDDKKWKSWFIYK